MKKVNVLVLGLIGAIVTSSCIKNDPQPQGPTFEEYLKERLVIETPLIRAYLAENNIAGAIEHEASGIWYVLESPGQGEHNYISGTPPYHQRVQTKLVVKYTGKLLTTDEYFAEETDPNPNEDYMFLFSDAANRVQGVIPAWLYAFLPKSVGGILDKGLQEGAKIRIITPSPHAYQDADRKDSTGKVTIPANSVLDFTIEVLDLANPSN